MLSNPRFSGHESFQCRFYWLKKGYDFLQQQGDFNADYAPVQLGVGKNMVTSIRYWMKAFDVLDEESNQATELALFIFDDKRGKDPFLEDHGTLWLLHYLLIKKGYATTYPLLFNQLRKKRPEFNFGHFESLANEMGNFSSNTLKTDFQIFGRMYTPRDDSKDLDETYSGLLTELGLVQKRRKEKMEWYSIEPRRRPELPADIVLYCILDNPDYGNSVSFEVLYGEGVGSIFALNRDGLTEKLEEIATSSKGTITYSNEAGIKELQFNKKPKGIDILRRYYEG